MNKPKPNWPKPEYDPILSADGKYSVAALRDFKHRTTDDMLEEGVAFLHAALDGLEMSTGSWADIAAAYLLTILDELSLEHDLCIDVENPGGFSSAEKAIVFFEDMLRRTNAAKTN